MNEKTFLIRRLKSFSILTMTIAVLALLFGLLCLFVLQSKTLSLLAWGLFGSSLFATLGLSIVRGVLEVKQKRAE